MSKLYKRQRADAIRAANMAAEGHTSKQIAEAIGVRPEQVKAAVLRGQRFKSENDPKPEAAGGGEG